MLVVLNGRKADLPEGITVADLVAQKNLDPEAVIVEHNGELVKKDTWPVLVLKENDRLEILRFVGGG
ncbi:MAG: sulfur carrier protein ThiS [Firmicutes bacterium]|nr:sulfur carrier protein ThiS [Bacillota bacterium]